MDYKGYKILQCSDEDFNQLYTNKALSLSNDNQFKENEYLIATDNTGRIIDYFRYNNGNFNPVTYKTINGQKQIKPRNPEQQIAIDMLQDDKIAIKLLSGPFGSGKTLFMVNEALSQLEAHKFEKIVFIRNTISAKDTGEPIGALPGELNDKLLPYMMPLADHLGSVDTLLRYIEQGYIEPVHVGFLRGRDLQKSLIYCTESQNFSIEQIKILVGRIGDGSQLWLDGDFKSQVDRPIFEKSNGLRRLVERLAGQPLFGMVNLQKSERSAASALCDLLD